jgi:hypothetical protein
MLNVSQSYKDTFNSNYLEVFGKIVWDQIDITANEDVTVTGTSKQALSTYTEVYDFDYVLGKRLLTMEDYRCLLDGTVLVPSNTSKVYGWWSENFCDSSANFTPNEKLTFSFTTDHDSIGYTVVFDTDFNEYAVDFDIISYNSSNAVIDTKTVTDNTLVTYVNYGGVSDYRKIELVIKKWSTANRRARIKEFIFGLIRVYDKTYKLLEFNVSESLDLDMSECVPNKIDWKIDNSDKEYDILNPSGIFNYLQLQQKVKCYLGVNNEYCNMGTFYLKSWESDTNSISASFTAEDILSTLSSKYMKSVLGTKTAATMITDIFTDANIDSSLYSIDSYFSTVSINSCLNIESYKQCLQKIVAVCGGIMYVNRFGVIQIKKMSTVNTNYVLPLHRMEKFPKIVLDDQVKTISTYIYSFTEESTSSEIHKGTLPISGTENIWIEHDMASNISATVSSGTINSTTAYTKATLLNITATGNIEIILTGKKIKENKTLYRVNYNASGQEIEIDNKLVSSVAIAENLIDNLHAVYVLKNNINVPFLGSPFLELNDIINVETRFDDLEDSYIIQQDFKYNGALKSNIIVKG